MERKHHEHQSLALLAGVAVDKGPDVTLSSQILHSYQPYSTTRITDHPGGSVCPSQYNIVTNTDHNLVQLPLSHHSTTVQVPIQIEMAHGDGLDGSHTNVVEVQYIIDPNGEFHLAEDGDIIEESKIVLGQINSEDVQIGQVHELHITNRQSHSQVVEEEIIMDEDNIVAQEEVITEELAEDEMMSVHMNEIMSSRDASALYEVQFKPRHLEQYENSNSERTEDSPNDSIIKCFLCQDVGKGVCWKDLFDSESKKIMLPQLLNRYMNISVIPKYNSKNEHPVCEKCEKMLLRWHEVTLSYQEKRNNENSAASSGVDLSEDENSQDDTQPQSTGTKKRGKYQKKIGTRKYRYALLQSQIKTQIFNSSFHYLIKREFNDDDWEYIAERLHSTKSNSSAKVKEIENLIFQHEKLVSIFCDDCRKSISGGKEGYYEHRKTEHTDAPVDLTLPCDICGHFYPEKDLTGLSRNYFPHWIKHFYFEECQECKEQFPNPSLLKKHMVAHQERPGFPCPKCNKVLAKKITLEQHIKTHLPVDEKKKHALTCHICGKMITAPTLKAHMFSVHSDLRPWRCEVCGAQFKHKSDLSGHRNAVHLKIKNFNCNICGKSFGHHCGLRVHMMKHENRREHGCPTCGKKFITQWHLKKHMVTHKEEKDVICQTCGKGFKKIESLQEHITLHTGELPHECHICGRKVRVLSNLYKHYMVHKKNKTYYSKKGGLPDPLDAYIVEQQKNIQGD